MHGFPLPTAGAVRLRQLEEVRRAGLGVVSTYLTSSQRERPQKWAPRLRDDLEAAGLRLVALAGPAGLLLVHDESERRRQVADVALGIEAVARAGAERLFVQPGGFHPAGPWWYHPDNFAPASRRAYVRSLRELGRRAEAAGVGIVVEGYQGSVVESVEVMRELIEEAGCDAVGANLDYVNFLTPPAVARWPASLHEMADALGPRLASVHVKDCVVEPRLSCHVDERSAGAGELDLAPVVTLGWKRRVPLLVEHLRPRNARAAIDHLVALSD